MLDKYWLTITASVEVLHICKLIMVGVSATAVTVEVVGRVATNKEIVLPAPLDSSKTISFDISAKAESEVIHSEL